MESLSVNSRDDAILFGLVPTATPQFKQAYDEAIRQLHRNNSTAATTGKELSAFELPNMLKSTKCELRTLAVHVIRLISIDAQKQGPTGSAWVEIQDALSAGIIPALFEELEDASKALFQRQRDISCYERLELLADCLEPLLSRAR